MRHSPRVISLLALVAVVVPVSLAAVVPDDEGLLHLIPGVQFLPVLISNCAPSGELPTPCPGDQFLSYVDGDMVVYVSSPSSGLAYYDFFSGATNYVPGPTDPNRVDYWPGTSGGRIAFTRLEVIDTKFSWAILVYDTSTGTTAEIARVVSSPDGFVTFPAIGGNTVAYVESGTGRVGLWVADLANPGAAHVRLSDNDGGTDERLEFPAVSSSGSHSAAR